MKRILIPCVVVISLLSAACKKSNNAPLPTTMTFVLNKDTVWKSANVITDNQNTGTVFITGTSTDGSKSLAITLSGYTGKKQTFVVDYRGPGGNMTGNTGMYKDGSSGIAARAGKIVITEVSDKLIKGTFDLHYLQDDMLGSFTAPAR